MNKRKARAMLVIGTVIFFGGMFAIGKLLVMTKEFNANAETPQAFIVASDLPYCNCDIDHSLAWNTIFGIMGVGAIVAFSGIAYERYLTRRGS